MSEDDLEWDEQLSMAINTEKGATPQECVGKTANLSEVPVSGKVRKDEKPPNK